MPKQWDSLMKTLVNDHPQEFVDWLIEGAQYEVTVSPELSSRAIHADGLYKVQLQGEPYLVHLEFQTRGETQMARRLWEYNLLATRQYEMPVYSFVLYLTRGRKTARSPYQVLLADKQAVHSFRFWPIKLWDIETDDVLKADHKSLLPLAPLTRQGRSRATVERVIEILYDDGKSPDAGLLALTYGLAALALKNKQEQKWLRERFAMLDEILEESWAFRELREKALTKGWEQGLAKGHEQGLEQGSMQALEETLYSLVEVRFPGLLSLVRARRAQITNHRELQKLVIQVGTARDEQEARMHLR